MALIVGVLNMKNQLVLVLLICTLFSSCSFYPKQKTSLCVRNYSENKSLVITSVYIKRKEDSCYERVWTGNLEANQSEFIFVEEGSYSVKIDVADTNYFGLYYSFTTGYNIYKTTSQGNVVYVQFDGKGIYFE